MKEFSTPILFLVFNRPDVTQKVFSKIRELRPFYLFIAADGPRPHVEADRENCAKVREIVGNIDWDCKVKTLYRDQNLGCKRGVSEAITWFFDNVDEGIILEDDCLPSESFFHFCRRLLEEFRDDKRIMQISGTNLLEKWREMDCSYFYSYFGTIWGWATWQRAWKLYDVNMRAWEEHNPEVKRAIKDILVDDRQYKRRVQICEMSYSNQIDTWDYQWTFCKLINSGLSISPSVNLVSNIGFEAVGTHTKGKSDLHDIQTYEMKFPLNDNRIIVADREYDSNFYRKTSASMLSTVLEKVKEKLF